MFNFVVEEVCRDFAILTWNVLAGFQDLNTCNTMVEGLTVELELRNLISREAIVLSDKEVDLIFLLVQPLDVAISFFVILKTLIWLSVAL